MNRTQTCDSRGVTEANHDPITDQRHKNAAKTKQRRCTYDRLPEAYEELTSVVKRAFGKARFELFFCSFMKAAYSLLSLITVSALSESGSVRPRSKPVNRA